MLDGFEPFEVRGEEHRVDVAAVGWAADDVGDRDAFLLGAMEQVRGDAEFDPSRGRFGVRAECGGWVEKLPAGERRVTTSAACLGFDPTLAGGEKVPADVPALGGASGMVGGQVEEHAHAASSSMSLRHDAPASTIASMACWCPAIVAEMPAI